MVRFLCTVLALLLCAAPSSAQPPSIAPPTLHIDIPVDLEQAKVLLNMDHLVYEGATPTGLGYMKRMVAEFTASKARWQMIAIFHGPAGYMLLNDAAYDRERRTSGGNPYRPLIAELQKAGVRFEECGFTARVHHWGNVDLLPGVKVNSGANFRIVQLAQEGFVVLQP